MPIDLLPQLRLDNLRAEAWKAKSEGDVDEGNQLLELVDAYEQLADVVDLQALKDDASRVAELETENEDLRDALENAKDRFEKEAANIDDIISENESITGPVTDDLKRLKARLEKEAAKCAG